MPYSVIKVKCIRCTATAEGETADEAALKLDHAVGSGKGRPCAGGKDAPVIIVIPQPSIEIPPRLEPKRAEPKRAEPVQEKPKPKKTKKK